MKNRWFLLFIIMSLAIQGQCQMVMPPALKAGDTIAIISPSSSPDSITVTKGCAALREWGYVPVVGPHALSDYHGFAGTADERAADLLWALRDSTIKAIMCSRGGMGPYKCCIAHLYKSLRATQNGLLDLVT